MKPTEEQYIEHEVKLRVLKEVNDGRFISIEKGFIDKFKMHEKRFDTLESKINWLITLVVSGMILPIFLHFIRVV